MPTRHERRARNVAAWADTSWDDVALFLGPHADRFLSAWEKTRERALDKGAGVAIGWSWPAFFFGFAWFLYRKQWAIGVVLLILPIVIGYFLESSSGQAGVAIVMAMYAKSFVVQDAVTRTARIRAAGGDDAAVAAAGGVSMAGGIVGGIIWLIGLASFILAIVGDRPAG